MAEKTEWKNRGLGGLRLRKLVLVVEGRGVGGGSPRLKVLGVGLGWIRSRNTSSAFLILGPFIYFIGVVLSMKVWLLTR